MTIFVTWQLRVMLDSLRNSFGVSYLNAISVESRKCRKTMTFHFWYVKLFSLMKRYQGETWSGQKQHILSIFNLKIWEQYLKWFLSKRVSSKSGFIWNLRHNIQQCHQYPQFVYLFCSCLCEAGILVLIVEELQQGKESVQLVHIVLFHHHVAGPPEPESIFVCKCKMQSDNILLSSISVQGFSLRKKSQEILLPHDLREFLWLNPPE